MIPICVCTYSTGTVYDVQVSNAHRSLHTHCELWLWLHYSLILINLCFGLVLVLCRARVFFMRLWDVCEVNVSGRAESMWFVVLSFPCEEWMTGLPSTVRSPYGPKRLKSRLNPFHVEWIMKREQTQPALRLLQLPDRQRREGPSLPKSKWLKINEAGKWRRQRKRKETLTLLCILLLCGGLQYKLQLTLLIHSTTLLPTLITCYTGTDPGCML